VTPRAELPKMGAVPTPDVGAHAGVWIASLASVTAAEPASTRPSTCALSPTVADVCAKIVPLNAESAPSVA